MSEELRPIASFTVNHDKIGEGMYISRIDGDITTYDLRTRVPNGGDYMEYDAIHSFEHLFATYVRNSRLGDRVIYFGPMGCRTGYYLLVRDSFDTETLAVVREVLASIVNHDGPLPGAGRVECGNYLAHDVDGAKADAARYLKALDGWRDFSYPND